MRFSERRTERRLDQPKADIDNRERGNGTKRNGESARLCTTDAICIDDRLLQAQPLCDRD